MTVLLAAAMAWVGAWFGGNSDDWVCRHQEWTAHHMQEQLGWSMEKGRKVAAQQCRAPFIKADQGGR